jgi:hypothetical protein
MSITRVKNPANNTGFTPFHFAARFGHLQIVQLSLEHANDKNPSTNAGMIPLHWAAKYVQLILDSGACMPMTRTQQKIMARHPFAHAQQQLKKQKRTRNSCYLCKQKHTLNEL